jgi:ferrous iron transport protein A
MISLAEQPMKEPARIARVGGERSFRRRLLELGFLPGTTVEVLGVAPMGDPLDLVVRGCRFSLRRAEAGLILVAPEAEAEAK